MPAPPPDDEFKKLPDEVRERIEAILGRGRYLITSVRKLVGGGDTEQVQLAALDLFQTALTEPDDANRDPETALAAARTSA